MALQQTEQLHSALARARSVLVLCRATPSVDEMTAAVATSEILKQLGKVTEIVCQDYARPHNLKFLPELTHVKPALGQLNQFIVRVKSGDNGIDAIHQQVVDDEAFFYITPKHGALSPHMVSTESSPYKYDLVMVVGAQDLQSLGAVFTQNSALFHAVPVVNIDHSPANEYFGHVNYVDMTLTSNTEVVYALFSTHPEVQMRAPLANLLLTGMISATQSFKTQNVNARTLQTASALIALGADREMIVHHLYRQRSVATLRLWGAALSHLQSDPQQPLMWSSLTREDFARAGAGEHDLDDLITELIYTAPTAKVFALLYERPSNPDQICVIVDAQKPHNADALTSGFVGTRSRNGRVLFVMEKTALADAMAKVTNVLRVKMRT